MTQNHLPSIFGYIALYVYERPAIFLDLLDSDSRYYLACSVKAPIAGHVCAVIGQTPLAASYLIWTLLVFHLAAHFNVEVSSSRDTGRAHTWATCGMVCRRKHRKSAFSWPVSRLSFSWPFDQPDSRDDTEARLAPPMAVHTCLPACLQLLCVGDPPRLR